MSIIDNYKSIQSHLDDLEGRSSVQEIKVEEGAKFKFIFKQQVPGDLAVTSGAAALRNKNDRSELLVPAGTKYDMDVWELVNAP